MSERNYGETSSFICANKLENTIVGCYSQVLVRTVRSYVIHLSYVNCISKVHLRVALLNYIVQCTSVVTWYVLVAILYCIIKTVSFYNKESVFISFLSPYKNPEVYLYPKKKLVSSSESK